MNFFEAQDQARKSTVRLVVLFILAIISLIVLAELLLVFVLYINTVDTHQGLLAYAASLDPGFHVSIVIGVLLVVAAGSLYKIYQMSAGGHMVADMLSARLVPQNTDDPAQRRLLNVVEEMAIASGVPVPSVYVLGNERGVNAFAAGLSTDDAVVCVTQGLLEALDRDALQGVVAHEFSHILNGDMRLNIRIASILNGILLLGLIGARMFRFMSYRRASRVEIRGNAGLGLLTLSAGLMAIGIGGTFFGSLIKATINRQREYLADASAVQFTRNPDGIATALKTIGGYVYGSKLLHPRVPEFSHFFFASSAVPFPQSLFATHPPLRDRILRIDPRWDGQFPKVATTFTEKVMTEELVDGRKEKQQKLRPVMAIAAADAISQLHSFKDIDAGNVVHARGLLESIPAALKDAARDPYHARALIYALLLSEDKAVQDRQCDLIKAQAEPGVDHKLTSLHTILKVIGREYYLSLVGLAIPTLQSCSQPQKARFQRVMNLLIRFDQYVSLFEWCLSTLINNSLDAPEGRLSTGRHRKLHQLSIQVKVMMSMLAQVEEVDSTTMKHGFERAVRYLNIEAGDMYPTTSLPFNTIDNALKQLDRLLPMDKQRLIEACFMAVSDDHHVSSQELDVIRAIAAALHCPMPATRHRDNAFDSAQAV